MLPIKREHFQHLCSHNITVRELFPVDSAMSQPPSKVIHLPRLRMVRGRGSGIRVTNVKTIKPPDPALVKQLEENKLRAQLQKEIVSRSRCCAHKSYECHLPVVTGRQFCAQHILQDPSAPYRKCAHSSGSARCPQPAPAAPEPRDQRDAGLCYQHARQALLSRSHSAAPPPPVTTTETLLQQLNHYVRGERARTSSCASAVSVVSEPELEQASVIPLDPFKQIDATAVNAAYSASIMECASASDSDGDSVTLGPKGSCREQEASDYEDAPVEDEPLWRAGVYTAEEAVSEAKSALVSLQSSYIRQMGRLRALLQTARLKYLRDLKAEKELYCSINAQSRSGPLTVRERRQLRKLKAYAGYHHKHGQDAVLARKLQRKRAKVNDVNQNRPVPAQARCTYTDGGVRCSTQTVPAAKHCLKHILHDTSQVLFHECGDVRGLWPCREPVARLPLPSAACRHHTMPPAYTVFTLKKDESDSDDSRCSSEV